MRISSATAWTTLALTINADGSSMHELVGASPFPRHWIYEHEREPWSAEGGDDRLQEVVPRISRGTSAWGDEESEALVTAAEESALERDLARTMMSQSVSLKRRSVKQGDTLVEQGDAGDELYLLLDGVLSVEVDGKLVAEIKPGAILGEGAALGDGTRMATLRARTKCRVGVIPPVVIERSAMEQLAAGRRADGWGAPC